MKKILITFLFLLLSFPVQAKVKSKDIKFPGKFYTDEIKTCAAMPDVTFELDFFKKKVEGLIGYDWPADHKANSNSLNVEHKNITEPIKVFLAATHNAISEGDKESIEKAKKLLIDLAKADTLYDSISIEGLKSKPKCWANNDPNSPCWYHQYEFARGVFSNYMIGALWLKTELNDKEFKRLINNQEFLEYAKVFNNFYGSSKKIVYEKLEKSQNVLFDIDWQGTKKIKKKKLKYKLLTVFILPPTKNELYKRLLKRERKNHVTVKKRMKQFKSDILHWKDYDYVVVNDDLIKCYKKIMSIISKKNKKKPFYDKKKIKKHIENLLS